MQANGSWDLTWRLKTWIFDRFSKNPQTSNFMKIRLMRADFFHTDGQTYAYRDRHDEVNNHFSQFCEGT